ncbi:hypothetical protein BDV33DRAFT_197151 [Aspergillus novoparasiticus]|uniref:Uncharacterized protein n=1 Tax=Aspergillus novoparasiticus TaxID=986946 RepID=A0A5N6E860_9EURO|nr:hypothetical protein BDV33DRAFT_197151 [Aspergillus novoparasiticus]
MAASSGANVPYQQRVLSGHITELLVKIRQKFASSILLATPPPGKATLYLPFDSKDDLVGEIENQFNRKMHHCYVAVFFRGEFTVGEKFDTVIIPLEKIGNEHARPKDRSLGSTLDWSGLQYFYIKGRLVFVVDGGKLASVVVAFDRGVENTQS